jgi:hypothetical protein
MGCIEMGCLQNMYSIYTENLIYSTRPKLAKCRVVSKDRGCVSSCYQTKYRGEQKSRRQSTWSVFLGSIAQLHEHTGPAGQAVWC